MKMTENQFRQGIAQLLTTVDISRIARDSAQTAIKDPNFHRKFEDWLNGYEPEVKFRLLVDLGTIIVPDDYDSATFIDLLWEKHEGDFYYQDGNITSANFPNPSRVLKPGDRLNVRAFEQIVSCTTTSEERMAFLNSQPGAVNVGAHGAGLVLDQKSDQLSKDKWYLSFDEKDQLLEDADGYHRVPGVSAISFGCFDFNLGRFECDWDRDDVLLSFCDEQSLDQ